MFLWDSIMLITLLSEFPEPVTAQMLSSEYK